MTHSPSATLFHLLYEEWDAAQWRAEDAWAQVWRRVSLCEAGEGNAPTEQEVARAVRLTAEAREWLAAVHRQIQLARERVEIL